MNKQELIKMLNRTMEDYTNEDRFGRGVRTGLSMATFAIKRLYEPEKVVIPKFAAEWIEKAKEAECPLAYAINQTSGELGKWLYTCDQDVDIRKNQELFAKAWVGGYEVEKEKLYYVLDKKGFLMMRKYEGEIDTMRISNTLSIDRIDDASKYLLTEKEIKDYDERYWAFAVEVAE